MMSERGHIDAERLRILVSHGTRWARTALEQLCGRPLCGGEPESVSSPPDPALWEAGTFVAFEGDLQGSVGLLLTSPARDELVRSLTGVADPAPEAAASALRELGNIVASQAVSAMANEMGGRVLPSLPELADHDAGRALASFVAGPGERLRFEIPLHDRAFRLRVLLVVTLDTSGIGS